MVRKNEYKLNKKVNESILKKCGFRKEHGDCYTLKHFLYEKYVSLNILVMLDDLSLTVNKTPNNTDFLYFVKLATCIIMMFVI